MKRTYQKPEADKIAFHYSDQVVAASGVNETNNENNFMVNSLGLGSPICGSDGIVDRLFDFAGSSLCD